MFKPKITQVNLSAFVHRLFHEHFSSIVKINLKLIYIGLSIHVRFILGVDLVLDPMQRQPTSLLFKS